MTSPLALHFTDTETTGIIDDYPDAEITEIAIVKWCDGETEEILHAIVRPKKKVPDDLTKFNKSYSPEKNGAADSWGVSETKEVTALLLDKYMAGSNPDFDKRMIAAECFRTGQPRPKWSHRSVNTVSLGFMLWCMGETNGTGLVELARYFGVKHEAHTALGDCYAAIGVWEAFFDRFIFRPKRMKEALESLRDSEASEYNKSTIQIAVDLAQFANEALTGEL